MIDKLKDSWNEFRATRDYYHREGSVDYYKTETEKGAAITFAPTIPLYDINKQLRNLRQRPDFEFMFRVYTGKMYNIKDEYPMLYNFCKNVHNTEHFVTIMQEVTKICYSIDKEKFIEAVDCGDMNNVLNFIGKHEDQIAFWIL